MYSYAKYENGFDVIVIYRNNMQYYYNSLRASKSYKLNKERIWLKDL